MVKRFYLFASFLLLGLVIAGSLRGTLDATAAIAASVGAVILVYSFGLWAVFRNQQQPSDG